MYLCIYVCIFMFMNMYIWVSTHTHRCVYVCVCASINELMNFLWNNPSRKCLDNTAEQLLGLVN